MTGIDGISAVGALHGVTAWTVGWRWKESPSLANAINVHAASAPRFSGTICLLPIPACKWLPDLTESFSARGGQSQELQYENAGVGLEIKQWLVLVATRR